MTDFCYLDTTILIEALYKTRRRRNEARAVIQGYRKSVLPMYAVKEMSVGALSNMIWLHNRLVESRSMITTYGALAANLRARNRVATSLEALQAASEGILGSDLAEAANQAQLDQANADMIALSLRRRILRGWSERRRMTTEVAGHLDCFPGKSPYFDEELGKLRLESRGCPGVKDCCYAPQLRKRGADLAALLKTIEGSTRDEDNRRRKSLHLLKNTPKREFRDKDCRNLGDAYFALHCPKGATILTTNYKDHAALAEALGHSATSYVPTIDK